jgi:hypothetical protein
VIPAELPHVVPDDRDYLAAEMTAFLRCWLSGLRCPVVNRPTPLSLSGPGWTPAHWTIAAARLGMSVRPWHHRAAPGAPEPDPTPAAVEGAVTMTVIGAQCLGDGCDALAHQARALADAAGVRWLAVRFAGPGPDAAFLDAHATPGADTPESADTLAACLLEGVISC